MKRPLSLTVLAWFVIVSNVIGLISMPFSLRDPNAVALLRYSPLPLEATVAIAVVSEGLHLVAGTAILKRRIWGARSTRSSRSPDSRSPFSRRRSRAC